jgi:hypothetical protein
MNRRTLLTGLALALTLALPPASHAQTPFIAVYFDPGFSVECKDCPGQMLDVWYVTGVGFNTMVTGAEFAIQYPPAVAWVGDLNTPPVTIGQTPTGISMGYATPLNGYAPVGLCQVQVFWVCEGCAPPYYWNLVKVVPHPCTGFLGWTDETFRERAAVGRTSIICGGTPVEETTWGRVKVLFEE